MSTTGKHFGWAEHWVRPGRWRWPLPAVSSAWQCTSPRPSGCWHFPCYSFSDSFWIYWRRCGSWRSGEIYRGFRLLPRRGSEGLRRRSLWTNTCILLHRCRRIWFSVFWLFLVHQPFFENDDGLYVQVVDDVVDAQLPYISVVTTSV